MKASSVVMATWSLVLSTTTPAAADGYDPEYHDYGADDREAGSRPENDRPENPAVRYHALGHRRADAHASDYRVEQAGNPVEASAAPDTRAEDARSQGGFGSGHFQFRAGGTYRRLYDIPVYAGEIGAAFGAWDQDDGDYLSVDLLLPGRTESGLAVWGGSLGYRADWVISRARLGFNVGVEMLKVQRVTDDEPITGAGLALSVFVGYDVLRTGTGVLSIDSTLNLDPFIGNYSTLVWGPSVGLSYRL